MVCKRTAASVDDSLKDTLGLRLLILHFVAATEGVQALTILLRFCWLRALPSVLRRTPPRTFTPRLLERRT